MSSSRWSSVEKVRQAYVDFFVQKCGHRHVPSSAVVPHNDPTLLFVNAGMNQFKPILQGTVDPNHPFHGLKRAANSQKCIRAGGKHNDLDDVGKDTYHHTFFEMLGNWSFGDYFKKEAIGWAWELLTEVYGLDASRLYVTYFGGDAREPSVPADLEARDLWLQYLPAARVLPFGLKENFWEMGDTGPCGPCSEIHFDRIGGRDASALVNMDDPDVLEIWNLVFMQFNREKDRSLVTLPATGVDTGMGLERLASVLQDKRSNYDIDSFQEIFRSIRAECPGLREYTGILKDPVDIAYRVVADHIRTLTVALSDGAVPSNQDRGYVLRRILRRAVRYGNDFLGAKPGFFANLAESVQSTLGSVFPEIGKNLSDVKAILLDEEMQFRRTLEKGTREFNSRISKVAPGALFSGEDAFVLFTTFGFPLDLTQLMALEKGVTVDVAKFNEEFERFRQVSRDAGNFSAGEGITLGPNEVHHLESELALSATDDSPKFEWDSAHGSGGDLTVTVQAVWDGKLWREEISDSKTVVALVLDRTPFYSEQGGQTFDIGTLKTNSFEFQVTNAQKYGKYVIHIGTVVSGNLIVGESCLASVDFARRALVAKNHTATHILNLALRQVLGDKVDQKGSLVEPGKLRFDFSYNKPLELADLQKIEELVNRQIEQKFRVFNEELALEKAKTIPGVRAMFGEVYPSTVRVISVGKDVKSLMSLIESPMDISVEFCGGTHVGNSAEIFKLHILTEEGVAKGVRRIVAVTGPQAAVESSLRAHTLQLRVQEIGLMKGALLDEGLSNLRQKISEDKDIPLLARRGMLTDLDTLKDQQLAAGKEKAKELLRVAVKAAEGVLTGLDESKKFHVIDFPELLGDAKALGVAVDTLLAKIPSASFLGVSAGSGKVCVVAARGEGDKSAKLWVDSVLGGVGGKGGGSDARAQGQVVGEEKLAEIISKASQ